MGMFDYVDCKLPCPNCGETLDGFQTKDGECFLDTVKPHQVRYFYTGCDSCDCWVDVEVIPPSGVFTLKATAVADHLKTNKFMGEGIHAYDPAIKSQRKQEGSKS
jgi:hypothetical protein